MTKKDLRLISLVIRDRYDIATDNEQRLLIRNLVYNMATVLAVDNPRFNRDKFLATCMGEQK